MLFLLTSVIQEQPAQVNFFCDVCTIIVQGVEDQITDPQNVQEVEAFLDQVCEIIPFDFYNWCEQIINQYYGELIKYIQQGLPAAQVCKQIGLCD
ncbi:Saposin-like_type B domin-containing protein [Hexamita inflata]|uniref:Saposin-like type B domin-containing protein n=1 Tax=Hexamita inflata TaxID=28002 RepID=A0AA86QMF5_9EUKA|nr:Saposin-like type B domin-containing protein [Hexamita inflata]